MTAASCGPTAGARAHFGVVVFPGSNCDADCYHVIARVVGRPVDYVWHGESDLAGYDCIILPGGFAYGDHLRAGAIARFSPVMGAVRRFGDAGGLVLGICNGFQVLLEAGMLPGAMLQNASLRFACRETFLRVENAGLPFTGRLAAGQVLKIPIAHYQGNYFSGEQELSALEARGGVTFRYCGPGGDVSPAANPNGSLHNIAGICNSVGNVLGMMPHPERASEDILGSTDGRLLFLSAVDYIEGRAAARRAAPAAGGGGGGRRG